jgi:hypothetical protein
MQDHRQVDPLSLARPCAHALPAFLCGLILLWGRSGAGLCITVVTMLSLPHHPGPEGPFMQVVKAWRPRAQRSEV